MVMYKSFMEAFIKVMLNYKNYICTNTWNFFMFFQ